MNDHRQQHEQEWAAWLYEYFYLPSLKRTIEEASQVVDEWTSR